MPANCRPSELAAPQDLELPSRVRLTLSQTRHPAFHSLQVAEENGAIILDGELPSFYLKQLVQTIAGSVDGVRRLHNRVRVVRTTAIPA